MASPDVSACLIVKDAEAHLPRCLESIAGLVREVIVVDTGSTDGTRAQAEALGCRVYDFPWTDDFAAARNESLRHATGRWILCLDADEYFDEANRAKLRSLLESLGDTDAAYTLTQRSVLANGSPLDLPHTRLFRNHPAIRWQYRVHEQIAPSILRLGHPIQPTDIVMHHSGYDDPRCHREKTERNARLLELELQERPDDGYLLYNLGTAYGDLGQLDRSATLLRKSVQLTPPEYSTARNAYVALVQCLARLGQAQEAWQTCALGRQRYPRDVTLRFWQAQLLRGQGDLARAEQCLLELVRLGPATSTDDAAVRNYVAPHTLGLVYAAQGRVAEAEKQWQAVVAAYPVYKPSWEVLGELYLSQQRWADLDAVIHHFEATPALAAEGAILRSRQLLAQKEFAAARTLLEQQIVQMPEALAPRFYLTHVLMAEGKDWPASERALREVLRIDPRQAQAWYNLTVVLRRQSRHPEAREVCEAGLKQCPGDPHLSQILKTIRAGK
jgi:tetratricopeptide (TPR) repeat protein